MLNLYDLYVSMCSPFDDLLIYVDDINTLYTLEEFLIDFSVKDLQKLKFVYVDLLCVNGDCIQCDAYYKQLLELFIAPEAEENTSESE